MQRFKGKLDKRDVKVKSIYSCTTVHCVFWWLCYCQSHDRYLHLNFHYHADAGLSMQIWLIP